MSASKLVAVLTFLFLPSLSFADAISISPATIYQGDAVVVEIQGVPTSAVFDGREAALFPYGTSYRAVFGIAPTQAAGTYTLQMRFADGTTLQKQITVRAKKFPKVVLGIPAKLGLTPSGLVEKLQTEKINLDEIFSKKTNEILFGQSFGLALADNRKVGSVFGEVRDTNGTQIRHLGTDFTAKKGAAVGAINAGVVRKAYFDTVYGNSVVVDHGQGIFSFYIHLDKTKVKEGDVLRKGSLIGTVGTTGYAEVPHLHLSLKIGGVPVDPVGFVRNFR